jgi:homoserine kinase
VYKRQAYGCSISGSGPSIFAFSKSKKGAQKIGEAMKEVVGKNRIKSTLFISKINTNGPKIIS